MSSFDSIILGIVQGLTEFLPISSSGHLVLAQKYLGIAQHDLAMDMVIHLATLLVLLIYFRKLLTKLTLMGLRDIKERKMSLSSRFILLVIAGTIPTAMIGLAFKDYFESLFSDMSATAYGFIITGFILFFTRNAKSQNLNMDYANFEEILVEFKDWSYGKAVLVGVLQAVAIVPSISRSGITIASGILTGLSGRASSVYSFMLAIPAIAGGSILILKDVTLGVENQISYGLGFIASLIFGFMGLHLVLTFVKKGKLVYFSYYLWALGLFLLFI